jgi:hypothetical protein
MAHIPQHGVFVFLHPVYQNLLVACSQPHDRHVLCGQGAEQDRVFTNYTCNIEAETIM